MDDLGDLGDLLTGVAALIGGAFALYTYRRNASHDRQQHFNELRERLVSDPNLSWVATAIESENGELGAAISKVSEAENPYRVGLNFWEARLVSQWDEYLDYLDRCATLLSTGFAARAGVFDYYMLRLWEWEPAWHYLATPSFAYQPILDYIREAGRRRAALPLIYKNGSWEPNPRRLPLDSEAAWRKDLTWLAANRDQGRTDQCQRCLLGIAMMYREPPRFISG